MQILTHPIGQVIFMRWADCQVRRYKMKNVYENQNEVQWPELVIERAIVVPDEDFEQLIQPMDNEQSSIEQDTDDYYKQYHCIMVTGQNRLYAFGL